MIKTHKPSWGRIMLAVIAAAITTIAVTVSAGTGVAEAATTPRYTVTFDYTHYYHNNTTKSVNGSGTNVTSTPSLPSSQSGKASLSVSLYGSGAAGTGTLPNGGAINSSALNIEISSGFTYNTGKVVNQSDAEVGRISEKVGRLSGLSDGVYRVTIEASSPGWNPNPRTYARYSLTCTFSFRVDTVAPTGTLYGGTSAVSNNGSTKANYVKFTASDNGSGIKACYVKKPGRTAYETYSSNSQLTEEGKFSFYCVDNANNTSATYTITRDSTAPTLSCTQSNFYSATDKGFTVTASDTLSGAKLFYKTPSMSGFSQTESSYTVSNSAQDGKYYFYAEDGMGNRSNEVWIELRVLVPTATIVRSNTDNGVYATWTDNSTAKLNGQAYSKGTWIRTEGSYTLILQNAAGRTNTYTFDVGHQYVVARTVAPTCTAQGYTVYRCTSCLDSYTSDHVSPKGHRYEETTMEPTCTESGVVRHQCSVCDNYYDTEGEPATGHQLIEQIVLASCTESGGKTHTCSVCGFQYQTDTVPPTGHRYNSELIAAGGCTDGGERRHACETCGDTYSTEIPALGHQYEITDEKQSDGKTVRTYTCSVCGDNYTQDFGNQYEKVTSYVEYLFDLYSPYMIWVFLGTSGVWSIVLGVMIILAHKNEDKEKAKKMLVNYVIGLIVIFCILVACPYLIKGIAALIA